MLGIILLLLLKVQPYTSRIFNTKSGILAQGPEFLQPFYVSDHSNSSTAGYTKGTMLLQLSKIQLSCDRIFDIKIKLIRRSLSIS